MIDDLRALGKFSAEGPLKTDILKSDKFNVVLVCLEEGHEIPPHPEPYAVFFLVLEGGGVFTKGSSSFELTKGSSIFLDKDEVRGIRCLDRMTLLGVQDGH